MTTKRDYYEVLEVGRDASPEDVKKAFRRLALDHHPDRNKDAGAAGRFKEINEAYQVLSDPQRRSAYDQFGHRGVNGEAARGFDGHEGFGGFGDIFDAFFGGSSGRGSGRGRDLEYQVAVAFTEAAFGVEKKAELDRMELCDRCSGSRAEPGSDLPTCSTCAGQGQVRRVARTVFGQFQQVATCSTCGGIGKVVKSPCTQCRGRGVQQRRRRISINVPAGIEDGARIKMRGQGEPGAPGGPAGDLYVLIRVEPHDVFQRDGNDVHIEAELNIAQAALGAEITVPTLDGDERVRFKPGVQSGEVVHLRGKGIPQIGGGRRGDQVITLRVSTPTGLSARQKELLEEFARSMPGGDKSDRARSGLIGRVKDALGGDGDSQ